MAFFHAAPIVVGYDGSPTARAAVMVAAEEAARRDLRLTIVFAQETPVALREEEGALDPLVDAVQRISPILDRTRVSLRDRLGPAARVLCEQAAGAELLVVGRGEIGLNGWFAGSVALEVLGSSPCPVLIVGDPGPHVPHTGPVIAGVDREHADEILKAAFREADLRRSELVLVHVGAREDWLEAIVEPFRRKYPHVTVTEALREGRAATVLSDASGTASLVVVGSRGRGPVTGLVLGSVGQTLLRHALCPVLVVRQFR